MNKVFLLNHIILLISKQKGFVQGILFFSLIFLVISIIPVLFLLNGNSGGGDVGLAGVLMWVMYGLPTTLLYHLLDETKFSGHGGIIIIFFLAWLQWIIIGAIVGKAYEGFFKKEEPPPFSSKL